MIWWYILLLVSSFMDLLCTIHQHTLFPIIIGKRFSLCLRCAWWIWAAHFKRQGETQSASRRHRATPFVLLSRPERVTAHVRSLQPITGCSRGHLQSFRLIIVLQGAPSQLATGRECAFRLFPDIRQRFRPFRWHMCSFTKRKSSCQERAFEE